MKISKLISSEICSSNNIINFLLNDSECFDAETFIKQFEENEHKVTIVIGERFFFRNNSTLSITLIIDEQKEFTTVDIISSGGKVGIFSLSYGTENSAVRKIVNALSQLGFEEVTE